MQKSIIPFIVFRKKLEFGRFLSMLDHSNLAGFTRAVLELLRLSLKLWIIHCFLNSLHLLSGKTVYQMQEQRDFTQDPQISQFCQNSCVPFLLPLHSFSTSLLLVFFLHSFSSFSSSIFSPFRHFYFLPFYSIYFFSFPVLFFLLPFLALLFPSLNANVGMLLVLHWLVFGAKAFLSLLYTVLRKFKYLQNEGTSLWNLVSNSD